MAYIVMACIFMAYIVMALYSYGLQQRRLRRVQEGPWEHRGLLMTAASTNTGRAHTVQLGQSADDLPSSALQEPWFGSRDGNSNREWLAVSVTVPCHAVPVPMTVTVTARAPSTT